MSIDVERMKVDPDYWQEVTESSWGIKKPEPEFVEWNGAGLPPVDTECQPEPMDDNCPAARIGEIGNQAHNLGCDYQNDEDLSDELGQVAVTLWDLAKKVSSLDQAQRERDCARQNRISEMKEQAKRVGLMSMGPLEMKEPEWDGTGRPPVGAECKYRIGGGEAEWYPCTVKHVLAGDDYEDADGWRAVVWCPHLEKDQIAHLPRFEFRPIRTQAQREREETLCEARNAVLGAPAEIDAFETLYDAGMLRRAGE